MKNIRTSDTFCCAFTKLYSQRLRSHWYKICTDRSFVHTITAIRTGFGPPIRASFVSALEADSVLDPYKLNWHIVNRLNVSVLVLGRPFLKIRPFCAGMISICLRMSKMVKTPDHRYSVNSCKTRVQTVSARIQPVPVQCERSLIF